MEDKLKIVIVEDNVALAKGLQEKLSFYPELELAFTARHGRNLLELLQSGHDVDIILMDINMPVMNGIKATAEVKRLYPHIKVIMSTVFDEEDYILQAIMAGANGYLLKDERAEKIITSIRDVMSGGAPMSPGVAVKALNLLRKATPLPAEYVEFNLTKRETEILEKISQGQNYQQIAEVFFISPGTVRKHIENIYQKLQVHNKVEAVQLALKHRLI